MAMHVYWTPTLPQHWIFRDGDDVFRVPTSESGWAQRKPYTGKGKLMAVSPPAFERHILAIAGVPLEGEEVVHA